MEIKIHKRVKYAGDVHKALLESGWDVETATAFVNNLPDANAVEVVRCEECIHSITDGWICGGPSFTMPSHPTYPDAFCSYGERRTDG